MASLYNIQRGNVLKTWVLMGIFTIVLGTFGIVVGYYFNSFFITYSVIFIVVVWNFVSWYKSDKLIFKMTNAQKAKREEYFDLYNFVENIAITAGLPMPELYVIHDKSPNAFATGRSPEYSAVAVTTGLLDVLDRSELEGVIAHEISHIKNRDTLIMTSTVAILGIIAVLSDFVLHSVLFGGSRKDGNIFITIGVLVISVVLIPLVAKLVHFAISRKREFLADASGSLLTRNPEGLASALEKINQHSIPLRKASAATAHLFISNPFTEKVDKKSKLVHLFSTHPPVDERVKMLRASL